MPVLTETTDAPSTIETTYSMNVGQFFFGNIETPTDTDFIAVTLEAGQTYTFAMVGIGSAGTSLRDSYLRLLDAEGNEIELDDDGGPGLNSSFTVKAPTTGVFYLDAQAYNNIYSGNYGISMTNGSRANYDVNMGASNLIRTGLSWSDTPGEEAAVTWSIRDSGREPSGGNRFIAPSTAQVQAVQEAMEYIDGVSGLSFSQVAPNGTSNDSTMVFGAYSANDGSGAYAYLPGNAAIGANSGDVWLNNSAVSTDSLAVGSYSYFVILHEVGHALGLSHPGDYNAALGVSITYANNAQFIQDSHQYSVMSYFDEGNTASSMNSYPDTLMLYDLLALHNLYGADMNFHAGNTTYGFNATVGGAYDFTTNTDPFLSIWDGGGTDTLDLSGFAFNQIITLEEGQFSDVGGYIGNLSIAIGATIENAIGGSAHDEIYGNEVNNLLRGEAGNDLLHGEAGRDSLFGGSGNDSIYGGAQNDLIRGGDNDDMLYGEGGLDTLLGQGGDDFMSGGWFNDVLHGGEGNDTLRGDGANDKLFGGADDDLLYGGTGSDRLFGGISGADTVYGGAQHDWIDGGDGDDMLYGEGGLDTLWGQSGNDFLSGGWFSDRLHGGANNDTLYGDGGNDKLFGGEDDDLLYGGNGNDRLFGGISGADTIDGGTGNDFISGGNDSDVFIFEDGFGADTIIDFEATDDLEQIDLRLVTAISDFTDLKANHMTQVGANVVIDDGGGNTITLQNVDINDLLDGSDFIF